MEWNDAFQDGEFAPNQFLKSICYIIYVLLNVLPPFVIDLLPPNISSIVQSILFDDMELFYENASPLLGIGDDGNLMKGLFGMRLASVKRTLVRKNKMNNFQTLGPAALIPEDVPGYENVVNPLPLVRFLGNDAWFASMELCDDIKFVKNKMEDMYSEYGYSHPLDMANGNGNVDVRCLTIWNVDSPNTEETETMDKGKTFGVEATNPVALTRISKVATNCLKAGGSVIPFPQPSSLVKIKHVKNKKC